MGKEYSPIGHYLLNAYLAWFYENNISPINILINAENNVSPTIRGKADVNGKLVLNIAPAAVRELLVDKDGLSFKTNFGGVTQHVYLPLADVLSINMPVESGGGINISLFNYQEMCKFFSTVEKNIVTVGSAKPNLSVGLKLVKN